MKVGHYYHIFYKNQWHAGKVTFINWFVYIIINGIEHSIPANQIEQYIPIELGLKSLNLERDISLGELE